MPSGQYGYHGDDDHYKLTTYDNYGLEVEADADTSAASILRSVHEQEAQFEQLTRELERERHSVANQIERCKLGSETASLSSISSTDESFRWRDQGQYTTSTQESSHYEEDEEEDSDTESRSGSMLVESCLRVLQDRSVISNSNDNIDKITENILRQNTRPPPGLEGYKAPPVQHQGFSYSPQLSDYSNNSERMSRREETKTVTTMTTVTARDSPVHGTYSREYSYNSVMGSPNEPRSQSPGRYGSPAHEYPGSPAHGYPGSPAHGYPGSPTHGRDYTPQYEDRTGQYDDRPSSLSQYPDASHFDDQPPSRQYHDQPHYNERPSSISQYSDRLPSSQYVNQSNYNDRPSSISQYNDRPSSISQYNDRPPSDSPYNNDRYDTRSPEGYYPQNNAYPDDDYRNSPIDHRPLDYDDRYLDGQTHRKYPEDDRQLRRDDSYSNPPNDEDFQYRHPIQNQLNHSFSHEPPYAVVNKQSKAPRNYGDPLNSGDGVRNIPIRDDRFHSPSPAGSEPYGNGSEPRAYDVGPEYDARLDYPDRDFVRNVGAQPDRKSPSVDSETRDRLGRDPSLLEVIEFLSHPSNNIKANAAAYLQHLVFNNSDNKAKTRALGGIPALVELLNNDIPEVHRNACGALRNLSFGRENDDNKRAIKNAEGIPVLVRLLRKTPDSDVQELVTAILWNLSSCPDLKKPILDDSLTVLVNNIIIPHSGWSPDGGHPPDNDMQWSTVFRNASGTLRNISSDGDVARKKLRECDGLPDSLISIVHQAIGKNDIDNKSVENIVCVIRNMCYGVQEVSDPEYFKKRQPNKSQNPPKDAAGSGCFGGGKKKKEKEASNIDFRNRSDSGYQSGRQFDPNRPRTGPVKGMEVLWHPDVVFIYIPLLADCSNPETLEAAAGALQNLSAGDWLPSVDIRAAMRKEKGLPKVVELLSIEADRVVCAAATALRNLAIDEKNKELIGKYAMHQLVSKLPLEGISPEYPPSEDTMASVLATLYECVRKNPDFCQSLLEQGGVHRLVYITKSRNKYNTKVVKFASSVLFAMWQFKALHPVYKQGGFKEQHFITKTMAPKNATGKPLDGNSTLFRPKQTQGSAFNDHNTKTMRPIQRSRDQQSNFPANYNTLPVSNHNPPGQTTLRSDDQYQNDPYRHYNTQYDERDSSKYGQPNNQHSDRNDNSNYKIGPGDHYNPRLNESFAREEPFPHNERHSILADDRYDVRAQPYDNGAYEADRSHPDQRYMYDDRPRSQNIPMNDIRPYATFEETRQQQLDEGYRPSGGVQVFPNHTVANNPSHTKPIEPLYARVNKNKRNNDHMVLSADEPPADSWV